MRLGVSYLLGITQALRLSHIYPQEMIPYLTEAAVLPNESTHFTGVFTVAAFSRYLHFHAVLTTSYASGLYTKC